MEGKDSWTTRQPRFDTSNHTDASEFHCSKGVMIPTRAVMIANTKVRMNRPWPLAPLARCQVTSAGRQGV